MTREKLSTNPAIAKDATPEEVLKSCEALKHGYVPKYHSTVPIIDEFIGGGFGREGGGYTLLVHGGNGVSKTGLLMHMAAGALASPDKQCWIMLEDEFGDIANRLLSAGGPDRDTFVEYVRTGKLRLPSEDLTMGEKTTIGDIKLYVRRHLEEGVKLFFIDPLNFVDDFEDENPYAKGHDIQKAFINWLVNQTRKYEATVVYSMHNTKDASELSAGMGEISGSANLSRRASVCLGLSEENPGYISIRCTKMRLLEKPDGILALSRRGKGKQAVLSDIPSGVSGKDIFRERPGKEKYPTVWHKQRAQLFPEQMSAAYYANAMKSNQDMEDLLEARNGQF